MAADNQNEEEAWKMQACAGDQTALVRLVERYRPAIEHQVQQLLAPLPSIPEDALEGVVQRAQARLPELTAEQDVARWLNEISRAYCQDYLQHAAEQQQQHEERSWVQQTLQGDKAAFAQLYERYQSDVYTHAYYRLNSPADAQDAVQEVFQRAYLKLTTFDTSRRFRAWLLTIAANYCTDVLRSRRSPRKSAHWVSLDVVDYWIANTEADPERLAQAGEQRDRVREAVARLDSKYRELVVLFYWNDLSYAEISAVTDLKESTIKTRLHRARKELIELLGEGTAS